MAVNPLDIKITSTADTSGVDRMTEALKKQQDVGGMVTEEMKREAQVRAAQNAASEQFAQKTKQAAAASQNLAGELRGMQTAAQGANQVLNGLSQGSIGGLVQASRGAITVIRSLATGAIGATLLPALAGAGALFIYLGNKAKENAAAIEKVFKDGAAAAKAYENRLTEIKDSAEKSLESQLKAVNRLNEAYKELISSMDAAETRAGNLRKAEQDAALSKIDRDEALALSKAKTDQERDTIKFASNTARAEVKGKFSTASIDSDVLNAKAREDNANKAIADASAQQFEADKVVVAAQQKFDTALARVGSNPQPGDLAEAKAAKAELDAAKKNQEKVRESLAPTISSAEQQLSAAQQVREIAPLRTQTNKNQIEAERYTRQATISQPAQEKLPELNARITALQEEDRNLPMGWESERRGQIATELAKVSAERDAAFQAIGDFAKSETKARADLERTLKTASESNAGR